MEHGSKSLRFFIITLSLILYLACSPASTDNERTGASDSSLIPDEEFDDEEPNLPSNISGAYLTYENAGVRCAQNSINDLEHEVTCIAISKGQDGIEFEAIYSEDGLAIDWKDELNILDGELIAQTCVVAETNLSMDCNITTSGKLAKVEVEATFTKDDASKKEVEQLILPYSVGVSAGFMPLFPYNFNTINEAQQNSVTTLTTDLEPKKFGFETQAINKNLMTYYTGACNINGVLYLKNDHMVYKIENDNAFIELGNKDSYNSEAATITDDPLKVLATFEIGYNYCFDDKIIGYSGKNTFTYDPVSKKLDYFPKSGLYIGPNKKAFPDQNDIVFVYQTTPDSDGFYSFEVFSYNSEKIYTSAMSWGSTNPAVAVTAALNGGFIITRKMAISPE